MVQLSIFRVGGVHRYFVLKKTVKGISTELERANDLEQLQHLALYVTGKFLSWTWVSENHQSAIVDVYLYPHQDRHGRWFAATISNRTILKKATGEYRYFLGFSNSIHGMACDSPKKYDKFVDLRKDVRLAGFRLAQRGETF